MYWKSKPRKVFAREVDGAVGYDQIVCGSTGLSPVIDGPGNSVFNQLDIIAALQTGNYLQGPYASLAKSARDAEVDAVFDEVGLQPLIRPI